MFGVTIPIYLIDNQTGFSQSSISFMLFFRAVTAIYKYFGLMDLIRKTWIVIFGRLKMMNRMAFHIIFNCMGGTLIIPEFYMQL
jgi:hypothetical protein